MVAPPIINVRWIEGRSGVADDWDLETMSRASSSDPASRADPELDPLFKRDYLSTTYFVNEVISM